MKAKLKLTSVFEKAGEGDYFAFIKELPGLNSEGGSLDESKSNLLEHWIS